MFTNTFAILASGFLTISQVKAISPDNTLAQMASFSEEKFLNFAQTDAELEQLKNRPYPYSFGQGDFGW